MDNYFDRIQKRDGTIEEFNINKFSRAIERAADAVGRLIDINIATEESLVILKKNHPPQTLLTVEDVLNSIEVALLKLEYFDVAKAFIIYRNRHNRMREQNSAFTKSIDNVSLDFEIKGNAASWLWEVAHASSYCYTIYKILPQRISHYFTENYIWIHNLPYFGRTIRSFSGNIIDIFDSAFLNKKGIKPAKRAVVLTNHLLQVFDSIHDDIAGEHAYKDFDIAINELLSNLPQEPTKTELKQAAEYFVYSLNNRASTHTTNKMNSPCLNIGLNENEMGNLFIGYMFDAILRMSKDNIINALPYIVFKIKDGINWNEEDKSFNLLNSALNIAVNRGNISFIWADKINDTILFSNGIALKENLTTNLQLTLNLPKIALNSDGNFYGNLDNIINISEEIISLNRKMLSERTADNFPTMSKLKINNVIYSGTERFSNIFQNSQTIIGITGLVDAIKILNPNISFNEIPDVAEEMLKKIQKRIHLQNGNYKLLAAYDLKINGFLYNEDRQKKKLIDLGITNFSPGISILPLGYGVKDRILLEQKMYDKFDFPVNVIVQKEKGKEEILDGIIAVNNKNAFISVR